MTEVVGRVAVLGERSRVQGFALAGAFVSIADDEDAVRSAWRGLPSDVTVVVLTPRLRSRSGRRAARRPPADRGDAMKTADVDTARAAPSIDPLAAVRAALLARATADAQRICRGRPGGDGRDAAGCRGAGGRHPRHRRGRSRRRRGSDRGRGPSEDPPC